MSVTAALYSGVSGLLANAEAINIISNNLANVNTIGYKASRINFADILSLTVGNTVGSINQVGRGVQVQKIDNTFSQGSFETTESVSDLAIQGDSFFLLGDTGSASNTAIDGINAKFTRAGSFRITPDADQVAHPGDQYLTNPDGLRVLDEDGMPIRFVTTVPAVATDFVKITAIDPQGRISFLRNDNTVAYYDGDPGNTGTLGGTQTQANAKKVGTINITGKTYIEKEGGSIYRATSATAGVPNAGVGVYCSTFANGVATGEKIFSSSLEQSNVDMGAQFVKMMVTQRAYSANSKSITTADEMTQELLNLKR